jgi:hypothetical protein
MFPAVPVLDGNFKRVNRTEPVFFNYEPLPNFNRDITLVFEGYDEEIKKMFALAIQPMTAISLHIRMGDYATNPSHFPPVTMEYVRKAINCMPYLESPSFPDQIMPFKKIIVFSDDIEYCKKNLELLRTPSTWFEYCEEKDEFKSLSLMASCSHHIIANSSFSWWGAFLGHNPDKIVVCPSYKNWFGPENGVQNPKDIPCSNWIQIEY